MIDNSIIFVFIPAFLFVSLTPGMCMLLALSLGLSIGIKRTLFMMVGELIGVGFVASVTMAGLATMLQRYPEIFIALKYAGVLYIAYIGVQLWKSQGKLAIPIDSQNPLQRNTFSNLQLFSHGLITAIANPKAWAFDIALLPPFINQQQPIINQVFTLTSIILIIEFICLMLYAYGGETLRRLTKSQENVIRVNKFTGTLMIGVGIWLGLS